MIDGPEVREAQPPASGTRGRIAIEGLEVVYEGRRGRNQALTSTDAVFEAGSFNALVGPTGCGKSTLLNVIGGFVAPTAGQVLLDGKPTLTPGPDRGVVFQSYALMPWFTASGNIEFALKSQGIPRAERKARAAEALSNVGLAGREALYPSELSGGMQQRVAIARTLAVNPTVLLMDEPFGALDAQTRMTMQQFLLDLWEADKLTVVFVTHDVDEALVLADRVFVMTSSPGKIETVIEVSTDRPRSAEDYGDDHVELRRQVIKLLKH